MSVLDNFLNAIQLNPDNQDDDFDAPYDRHQDEEFDDDLDDSRFYGGRRGRNDLSDDDNVTSIRQKQQPRQEAPMDGFDSRSRKNQPVPANNNAIRSMSGNNNRQNKGGQRMEICTIKPTSMDDTREVTLTLLQNKAVILNLEGLDVEVAQRIVDFVSGSCFAIKGNLQKISRYIFIITPYNVDVSGDFLETVGGGLSATTGGQMTN